MSALALLAALGAAVVLAVAVASVHPSAHPARYSRYLASCRAHHVYPRCMAGIRKAER